MKIYLIHFDIAIMKMGAEVNNIEVNNADELEVEINKILGATGYDFYDYSDEIAILVDDQGLFKEGLPVFEVESTYGDTVRLAGTLLFVRNVENEYSTEIGNIRDEDIIQLRNELKIQFIGFTKGVR